MISYPNAKINIGLAITSKRQDGFHDIASCFYPVGWSDILEIIPSEELSFQSTGIDIPGNADHNLCLQAYHLLNKDFNIPPVQMHLHKIIPIGAGLGGGSADGAFALVMLNEMNNLGLSDEQLEEYAAQMGSDCPFFIKNKPVYVTGRGEVFNELDLTLKGKKIVLVNPNIHISTKEAYSGVSPKALDFELKATLEGNIEDWKDHVKNDFEDSLLKKYTVIDKIKSDLYKQGAEYASMTGSGSTVFGIFSTEIDLSNYTEYSVWSGDLD
ncbi:4-(cytidine 5'-diphospho)-2-C-methyl-D-erythritol kinase [Flammeovirga agarivorans]|uniref:4-diphosphocytidyl-2-C-methyl-D-erythritol kinase n=1 Tax=Flammeovirga agarivorans TaxID=2726742 RepID=A0A7X8SIK3_9BACT|nr:4-(cytidine 5'-diphospho)-2-C-methyl-D-erythritol kinase [Flammeovirga agarivorans]NLR90928.1 4-(cytidine 5'-diphospho)-2-C-methyl-D-erythritol kinase [Flammeovirga agarivorans]